jgi:hypothetical protein
MSCHRVILARRALVKIALAASQIEIEFMRAKHLLYALLTAAVARWKLPCNAEERSRGIAAILKEQESLALLGTKALGRDSPST